MIDAVKGLALPIVALAMIFAGVWGCASPYVALALVGGLIWVDETIWRIRHGNVPRSNTPD